MMDLEINTKERFQLFLTLNHVFISLGVKIDWPKVVVDELGQASARVM